MGMHGKQWAFAVASVIGLVGCGEDTYVYDVEFDAAALAAVPTECQYTNREPPAGNGQGPARNLAAQQRWTLRPDRYGAVALEVPDLNFNLPAGPYVRDEDDQPEVFEGSSPDVGPMRFVDLTRTIEFDGFFAETFMIHIDNKGLEDGITGYLWLQSQWGIDGPGLYSGTCTSRLPFTGRRVKE